MQSNDLATARTPATGQATSPAQAHSERKVIVPAMTVARRVAELQFYQWAAEDRVQVKP